MMMMKMKMEMKFPTKSNLNGSMYRMREFSPAIIIMEMRNVTRMRILDLVILL